MTNMIFWSQYDEYSRLRYDYQRRVTRRSVDLYDTQLLGLPANTRKQAKRRSDSSRDRDDDDDYDADEEWNTDSQSPEATGVRTPFLLSEDIVSSKWTPVNRDNRGGYDETLKEYTGDTSVDARNSDSLGK